MDHETRRNNQRSLDIIGAVGRSSDQVGESGTTPINDLSTSVMRTVVSNGNDALNLLFEAAAQQHADDTANCTTSRIGSSPRVNTRPVNETSFAGQDHPRLASISLTSDIHKLWRSSRYVKMGWLSAEDIVVLLDL